MGTSSCERWGKAMFVESGMSLVGVHGSQTESIFEKSIAETSVFLRLKMLLEKCAFDCGAWHHNRKMGSSSCERWGKAMFVESRMSLVGVHGSQTESIF